MKRIVLILLLSILSASTVFVVDILVKDQTRYNNDFIRILPSHAADISSSIKIEKDRYSLAGLSNGKIYMRDKKFKNFLILNYRMKDSTRLDLDFDPAAEVEIEEDWFFVQNGNTGKLKSGKLENPQLAFTFTDLPVFTGVQTISRSSAVVRIIDADRLKNVFIKSGQPGIHVDILQKQVDGIFCTDGFLQYSREYNRLIYTYRYRNQFLVMDTNLNVVLKGKTIDTTSVAKLSVERIDGEIKMSKQGFSVNKNSRVYGKHLYISSNLVARNELKDESDERSMIDIYNITDGSYLFSFPIYNIGGNQMKNFYVNNHMLIALFPTHLVCYELSAKLLD